MSHWVWKVSLEVTLYPMLTLNLQSSCLSLLSSWDYKHDPLALGGASWFTKINYPTSYDNLIFKRRQVTEDIAVHVTTLGSSEHRRKHEDWPPSSTKRNSSDYALLPNPFSSRKLQNNKSRLHPFNDNGTKEIIIMKVQQEGETCLSWGHLSEKSP